MSSHFPLLSLPLLLGTAIIPLTTTLAQSPRPAVLSDTLQRQVLSTMQRDLGGNSATFKISQTESATWQDCPSRPNRPSPLSTCQPSHNTGHKVRVKGQGETWTYYVTQEGRIQLDGPASISPKAIQTLIKSLAYDPKIKLNILAARPLSLLPPCHGSSPSKPCNATPSPHWQILLEQRPNPITINLQGKIIHPTSLKSFLPKNLVGLDPNFAEAVLHDVRDRHLGTLPPNLNIESIKKTTWAVCNSGGEPAPGPGPSQPLMGACPVGTSSGWQVITRSGPIRWVHYVQPFSMAAWTPEPGFTLASLVSPDGPQSLPKATADAVLQAIAQQEKQPRSTFKIHWAESRFFDACLNPSAQFNAVNPAFFCRQSIQSGWQIQVMGRGKTGNFRVFNYHTNPTGSDIRFISANDWAPPPMAAPVGGPR